MYTLTLIVNCAVSVSLLLLCFPYRAHCSPTFFTSSATDTPVLLRTPSGAGLPASVVFPHLPHLLHSSIASSSSSHLDHAQARLFEHTPDGRLLSYVNHTSTATSALVLRSLAPFHHIPTTPPRSVRVNGVLLNNDHHRPVIRHGTHHVFVHDPVSGVLLAAWGPGMHLRPVHLKNHPHILVNLHVNENDAGLDTTIQRNVIHTFETTSSLLSTTTTMRNTDNDQQEKELEEQISNVTQAQTVPDNPTPAQLAANRTLHHFRPRWESERDVLFDAGFAFDASFCGLYANDGVNVSLLVHAIAVVAHEMSLTPIVSLRVGDIVGFCHLDDDDDDNVNDDVDYDVFKSPASLVPDKRRNPAIRLDAFKTAWQRYINDNLSDAAYLFTADEKQLPGNVVGSAWVASVCSDFRYGWVLHDHPVVLAHEMGHTLGAPHTRGTSSSGSSTNAGGLMSPTLNVTQPSVYSAQSLAAIEAFVARIHVQGCLVSRHVGGRRQGRKLRFSGFIRLQQNPWIAGTDIAVGGSSGSSATWRRIAQTKGKVDVATLYMQRYASGNSGAHIRATTLFRAPPERDTHEHFPFSYNTSFTTLYVPGSHNANRTVGGGIGMTSINLTSIRTTSSDGTQQLQQRRDNDVVAAFMKKNSGSAFYVVGYNFDANVGMLNGWSAPKLVRRPFGRDVRAIGADVGNLRGNGLVDLVLTYVAYEAGRLRPRFVVGYDLAPSGWARGGWSSVIPLPWSLDPKDATIGDISVAMWIPPAPENVSSSAFQQQKTMRLLFWHSQRNTTTGKWTQHVSRAEVSKSWEWARWRIAATKKRKSPIKWNRYVPDIGGGTGLNDQLPQHLSGGIALTNILSTVSTSVAFTQRLFVRHGSQWLDVGDGMLTQEQAPPVDDGDQLALVVGEDIIPSDACVRCYATEAQRKQCENALRQCFLHRDAQALGTVYAMRQQKQTQQQGEKLTPLPSLFCTGFHATFIDPASYNDDYDDLGNSANKRCKWDAKRMDIIAAGVRAALFDQLRKDLRVDVNFNANVTIVSEVTSANLRRIANLGPLNGPRRQPVALDLKFVPRTTQRRLRKFLIKQAFKKLRRTRPDFSSIFTEDNVVKTEFVKKGKKRFVVILHFNLRFQAEYLKSTVDEGA